MTAQECVAAGPQPSESPESGTNGPVPGQISLQGPDNPAVEARPNPFALPLPLWKTGPRLSPQHTLTRPRHSTGTHSNP